MPTSGKFCLLGQVLVDVTLSSGRRENKLRLGGIMHAARTMWALGQDYSMAYVAPAYLRPLVSEFATQHAVERCVCIGDIEGSPNVILIPEPTEAGPQGYELLLRESQRSQISDDELRQIASSEDITDVIIFPGGFDLGKVLGAFSRSSTRCYIDAAYDVHDLRVCRELGREFEVVMISTSSDLFLNSYHGDPEKIRDDIFSGIGKRLLLKENRGGVRLYLNAADRMDVGAQLRPITHSVGVGDCFDVAFSALRRNHTEEVALSYSSFIAADYAGTTYPNDFKTSVSRTLQIEPDAITQIEGVRVPWELRSEIQIYIAGPDFDYVDRRPIEAVSDALRYHNFRGRRPVLENGQAREGDTRSRKAELFGGDMGLLQQCDILLAVLLNNDPGTLIEIGLAKQQGKPVIVYDPYAVAENLVLQQIPDVLAQSLDETIAGVFEHSARLIRHDK